MRNAHKILVRNPVGKRRFEKHMQKCEGGDNIKIKLNEIECEDVGYIYVAQNRDQ
jgi:hypothetical protein